MTRERTHGRSAAAAGGGVGGGRGGTAALGPFKAWPCLARTPVAWAAGIEAEVGVEAKGVEDERRTCHLVISQNLNLSNLKFFKKMTSSN